MKKPEMQKIAVIEDSAAGALLRAILAEEGIACDIRRHEDSAYGNLFLVFKGWGEIWSYPQNAARIKEIMAAIKEPYN
jgi:hypothetical protein